MSIKYVVTKNTLREGEFYPRPVSMNTRRLKMILRQIAQKTTVSPSDIKAVIDAFVTEIAEGLVNGDRVSLDDFVDFRPRLSQRLPRADQPFDPASGGQLLISVTAKPSLTKRVRDLAEYEMVERDVKRPIVRSFRDARTKQDGVYSAGGSARLIGKDVQISDELTADEGIFFIAADGSTVRVNTIENNGSRRLVFEIPDDLAGPQKVQVRTRYTPDGELRVGELSDELLPAA